MCNYVIYAQHLYLDLWKTSQELPNMCTTFFLYTASYINPLKTKRRLLYLKTQFVPRRLLYLKTQFVPRSKHFSSRL